jgi:hypothetical protein
MHLMLEIISWYRLDLKSILWKLIINYKWVVLDHSYYCKWFNQIIKSLNCHQTLILAIFLKLLARGTSLYIKDMMLLLKLLSHHPYYLHKKIILILLWMHKLFLQRIMRFCKSSLAGKRTCFEQYLDLTRDTSQQLDLNSWEHYQSCLELHSTGQVSSIPGELVRTPSLWHRLHMYGWRRRMLVQLITL